LAARPWPTGIIRSRSPQTIIVGTPAARRLPALVPPLPAEGDHADERVGVDRSRLGVVPHRTGSRESTGLFQHFLNYLNEDTLRRGDPEAHQQDGIRVISAGPNAFLYVLDVKEPLDADALERRFPGLAEQLSQSPGVGFVLARSSEGAACFWHGKRYHFGDSAPELFASRADAACVIQGLENLMKMPSAGDLVIYGIDAPQGPRLVHSGVGCARGTFGRRDADLHRAFRNGHRALAHPSPGAAVRPLHSLSPRWLMANPGSTRTARMITWKAVGSRARTS
jgi:hypothetical protein